MKRTVRRPSRANTGLVRQALDLLAEAGAIWAPRFLALDGNEEVLSWLPGEPIDDWQKRPSLLDDLTRIVRELHDVTAGLGGTHECLVHDDLQPRNVVVDGSRLGLIDWEQLRPGRRIEDVAQLCWSFSGDLVGTDVAATGHRWRRVLNVYGLDDGSEVVPVSIAKIDRCIGDILEGTATGSIRHAALHDRGDHQDLERLRRWIEDHQMLLLGFLV